MLVHKGAEPPYNIVVVSRRYVLKIIDQRILFTKIYYLISSVIMGVIISRLVMVHFKVIKINKITNLLKVFN